MMLETATIGQILATNRHEEFRAEAQLRGQPWFEATVLAKDVGFSRWIGVRLGWRTSAAVEAMPALASHVCGRMTLEFDAAGEGPFAEDARCILDGEA